MCHERWLKHEAHACGPRGAVEEVRPPLSLSHTLLSCAVQCLLIIVVQCAIDLLSLSRIASVHLSAQVTRFAFSRSMTMNATLQTVICGVEPDCGNHGLSSSGDLYGKGKRVFGCPRTFLVSNPNRVRPRNVFPRPKRVFRRPKRMRPTRPTPVRAFFKFCYFLGVLEGWVPRSSLKLG